MPSVNFLIQPSITTNIKMKTLKELKEERSLLVSSMDALVKVMDTEKREWTPEETKKFDDFEKELQANTEAIEKREKVERFAEQRSLISGFETGEKPEDLSPKEKRDLQDFSVVKMIRSQIDGTELDGIEKEMHEEAKKEMKELGQTLRGFGIPSKVMAFKRDNSITIATQPEDGSVLVETDKRFEPNMMEMLRNQLVARQLGATYLNDLVGNVSFTRMIERPKASWKPEVGALDKTNVKFAADELTPKRLGTYIIQSLQFLRQTSPAVERLVRQEITYSLAEGVDIASIMGTGINNQPTGILNHSGIAALNTAAFPTGLGANGAALTRSNLIALRTALLKRNIRPGGNVKWLMNAATEGKLSDTIIAAGSDKFILETDRLLGYPYVMSNMVPSDLDKGTTLDSLSALIFGAWAELYIAQWGGIDLLVDPYTLAVDGQVKIVAQGFFNVLVHRPEAFAYFKDIVTTLA